MVTDIAQIISEGWSNGKSAREIADAVMEEFDAPAWRRRGLI